ncbi:MAG: hypothetical protein ACOWWR_12830 [Eubacteriales bacterium]
MKKNVIKKLTVSLLLMVMMMSIFAMPAMAATDYSMITLDDSADFDLSHAISTVVFLIPILVPWGKKLERIKEKFGLVKMDN